MERLHESVKNKQFISISNQVYESTDQILGKGSSALVLYGFSKSTSQPVALRFTNLITSNERRLNSLITNSSSPLHLTCFFDEVHCENLYILISLLMEPLRNRLFLMSLDMSQDLIG